jgi:hypothetical protein
MMDTAHIEIEWNADRTAFILHAQGTADGASAIPMTAEQYPALMRALQIAAHVQSEGHDWLAIVLRGMRSDRFLDQLLQERKPLTSAAPRHEQ